MVLVLAGPACLPEVIEGQPVDDGDTATSADEASTDAGTEVGTSTDAGMSSDSDTSTDTDTSSDTGTSTGMTECSDHDDCPGGNCLAGDCVVVSSCRNLDDLDVGDTLPSGVYELDPDGPGDRPPYEAYCELELFGGGWTLVLKSNGNLQTFGWDSPQWQALEPYQPQFPDLDRQEAKLESYAAVPVSEVLIGMESPVGSDPAPLELNWITVPTGGGSLRAVIEPSMYIPTAVGRDTWKGLLEGASLQPNCNREGFNVMGESGMPQHHRIRIGIIANEQDDCNSPNSRIGIGGAGEGVCNTWNNSTGNFAGCEADNGDVNSIGFGVVLVR